MDSTTSTPDPRTARTVAALRRGLRLALESDPPVPVTASEVARLAGVGRTSFYTHFTGVDELLATMLGELLEGWLQVERELVTSTSIDTTSMRRAFVELAADRDLFRAGFDTDRSGALHRALTEKVSRLIEHMIDELQHRGLVGPVDVEIVVPFSAGGLVTALEAWSRAAPEQADPHRWADALEQTLPRWWPRG